MLFSAKKGPNPCGQRHNRPEIQDNVRPPISSTTTLSPPPRAPPARPNLMRPRVVRRVRSRAKPPRQGRRCTTKVLGPGARHR